MYNQWKEKLNNTKFDEHAEKKYDIAKSEYNKSDSSLQL